MSVRIVETKYWHGDIVTLKADVDKLPRIVTEVKILPNNCIVYELCHANTSNRFHEIEIDDIYTPGID